MHQYKKRNTLKTTGLSVVIIVLLSIIGCDKEVPNGHNINSQIKYSKTISGGCNGQDTGSLKSTADEPDTVITSINNDTLCIFVGLNYICCAPFRSETSITKDSITITISDTCSIQYESCYCRCMCYYTWDFLFTDFRQKVYYYKIVLFNPVEGKPIVLREGIIEIS
jgi:hypothetical protein